jgi:hypothetical protein
MDNIYTHLKFVTGLRVGQDTGRKLPWHVGYRKNDCVEVIEPYNLGGMHLDGLTSWMKRKTNVKIPTKMSLSEGSLAISKFARDGRIVASLVQDAYDGVFFTNQIIGIRLDRPGKNHGRQRAPSKELDGILPPMDKRRAEEIMKRHIKLQQRTLEVVWWTFYLINAAGLAPLVFGDKDYLTIARIKKLLTTDALDIAERVFEKFIEIHRLPEARRIVEKHLSSCLRAGPVTEYLEKCLKRIS